jgi:enoyl-CoA hydratase/carnithine racemase
MLGDSITSDEALRVGLANKVVPLEELTETVLLLAKRLSESASMALGLTKRLIMNEWNMDLITAIEQEATAQALMLQSGDHREFHAAFVEKRKPRFEGR